MPHLRRLCHSKNNARCASFIFQTFPFFLSACQTKIRHIKIDFETDYNKFEGKDDNIHNIDNLDNLDDLKMQILNDEA